MLRKTVIEYPTVFVTVRGDASTAVRFRTLVSEVSTPSEIDVDPNPSVIIGELEKALAPPPPPKRDISDASPEGVSIKTYGTWYRAVAA